MNVHGYATHVPVLAWAVVNSKGPILELGCGGYSTPLLHALAGDRDVLSLETDPAYAEAFKVFASNTHEIRQVDASWDVLDTLAGPWGVVFVDQHPNTARGPAVLKFRDRADLIVVHDSELRDYYGLTEAFATMRSHVTCTWWRKRTTIFSDKRDLSELEQLFKGASACVTSLR